MEWGGGNRGQGLFLTKRIDLLLEIIRTQESEMQNS
jgi:hypothetical protein